MLKFGIPQVRHNNCERFSEEEMVCIDKALNHLKQHRTVVLSGEDRCSIYKIAVAVGNKIGSTAYMAMMETINDTLNNFQMVDLLMRVPEAAANDRNFLQRDWASQKAEAIRDMDQMCLIVDCSKAVFEKECNDLIARCGRNKNYIFMVPESEGGFICPCGKETLLKAHIEKLSDDANRVLHQLFLCGGMVTKELFETISDVNILSTLVEQGWIYRDKHYYRIAAPILWDYLRETDFDADGFAETLWKLSRGQEKPLPFADLRTVRLVFENCAHHCSSGKNYYRLGVLLRECGHVEKASFFLNRAASELSPDEEEFVEANFYAAICNIENSIATPEDYSRAETQLWIAFEEQIKAEIPCEYALATLYALIGRERAAKNIATLTLREAAGDVVGHYAGAAWALENIQAPFAFQLAKEVLLNADRRKHRHSLEAALRVLIQSDMSTNEDTLLYAKELVDFLDETIELPNPKLADAYIELADKYALTNDYNRAYRCLLKATSAYTWILPTSSFLLADLYSKMACVKASMGNTPESCRLLFMALRSERKLLTERECANRFISLGKQFEALNDKDYAILCFINAIRALADMEEFDENLMRNSIIHLYEMIP